MNIINKVKNAPLGLKASVGFFMGSVITSGISYIVTPICTRLLSAEEFGQYSLFMTWLQIFGIVAMFCLHYGVFNNGMVDYPEKRDEYSLSMLMLSNIITLIFSVVILSLYPYIKEIIGLKLSYIILMCIVFLFQPAYSFWMAKQRYELKYKWTLFWSVIFAVATQTISIICILSSSSDKLDARIYGVEISAIILYICFYIFLLYKNKFKVTAKYWGYAFKFNIALIPHYLSMYLLGNSNKIMISYLAGDDKTAYYSVAFSIASIALIVWSAINNTLIPFTYENCKIKNYKRIADITTPILVIFAGVCTMIIMFAPEVVMFMGTKEYMEAIYAIPPIIGGVFFQIQYYIYANIVYYYKKPKYVMYASVSSMILNIVLSYIFIKKFGYLSAGYVSSLCYLFQATIDYFAMKKVINQSIYNMKAIGFLTVMIAAIIFISNFIYDYIIIRYGVIILLLSLVFIFRNNIVKVFKEVKGK